ncbi:hypothetical protein V6N12_001418 [Hibiscus sabdariffa]|uniref:Uncharacterized protein n=1 Tax=Hibiscus sabdariffa TaxID=183260 RepID=A0ABR2A9W0_9ROSI
MGTRTNNGVLVLRGGNVGLGFRLWESRARQAFCRRKGRLERPGPDRRNRVAATVRPWNEAWVLAQRVTSGDWYVVYGLISNRVRVQWWYDNEGSGVPSFGLNGEWMKAYGLEKRQRQKDEANEVSRNGEVNSKDCQERRWGYGKGENSGEQWSQAQTNLKRVRGNSRLFVTKGGAGGVDGGQGRMRKRYELKGGKGGD